jgi:outer membrane protein TolC
LAQCEAAAGQLRARYREFRAGKGTFDILIEAARFFFDASTALLDEPAAQVTFCEQFLALAQDIEKVQQQRHAAGSVPRVDLEFAYDFTLDAEIRLAQAKRKAKSSR